MNKPDDNFLARWSRRKQDVKAAEPSPPDTDAPAAEPARSDAAEDRASDPQSREEAPASEPAEPLPSVEDLTADSDMTAFLRKGVPEALRSAALRRAWSLDPAIRDFVGLAEYQWDFNDPNSIPGFGTIGKALPIEKLVAFSTAGRAGPAPGAIGAGAPETAPVPTAAGQLPAGSAHAASMRVVPSASDVSAERDPATESAAAAAPDADPLTLGPQPDSVPATAARKEEEGPAAQRHGGALPR